MKQNLSLLDRLVASLFSKYNNKANEPDVISKPKRRGRRFLIATLLSLGLWSGFGADLQAQTWTGGGADDNWTTVGNWDTGVPVATGNAVFNGTNSTVVVNNAVTIATMGVSDTGWDFSGNTITGATLNLNAGSGGTFDNVLVFTTGAASINVAGNWDFIKNVTTTNLSVASGTNTFVGNVTTTNLTLNSGSNGSFAGLNVGAITATGGDWIFRNNLAGARTALTLGTGGGSLDFRGTSGFATTTVNGSTAAWEVTGLRTTALTLNTGTANNNFFRNLVVDNALTIGGGSWNFDRTGTFNPRAGSTILNGGTGNFSNFDLGSTVTATGGSWTLDANSGGDALTLGGTGGSFIGGEFDTTAINGGLWTIGGNLTDTLALSNTGTLTLSSSVTVDNAMTVNTGADWTVTGTGTINVGGDLILDGTGTLNAGGGGTNRIVVSGDLRADAGWLNNYNGVRLDIGGWFRHEVPTDTSVTHLNLYDRWQFWGAGNLTVSGTTTLQGTGGIFEISNPLINTSSMVVNASAWTVRGGGRLNVGNTISLLNGTGTITFDNSGGLTARSMSVNGGNWTINGNGSITIGDADGGGALNLNDENPAANNTLTLGANLETAINDVFVYGNWELNGATLNVNRDLVLDDVTGRTTPSRTLTLNNGDGIKAGGDMEVGGGTWNLAGNSAIKVDGDLILESTTGILNIGNGTTTGLDVNNAIVNGGNWTIGMAEKLNIRDQLTLKDAGGVLNINGDWAQFSVPNMTVEGGDWNLSGSTKSIWVDDTLTFNGAEGSLRPSSTGRIVADTMDFLAGGEWTLSGEMRSFNMHLQDGGGRITLNNSSLFYGGEMTHHGGEWYIGGSQQLELTKLNLDNSTGGLLGIDNGGNANTVGIVLKSDLVVNRGVWNIVGGKQLHVEQSLKINEGGVGTGVLHLGPPGILVDGDMGIRLSRDLMRNFIVDGHYDIGREVHINDPYGTTVTNNKYALVFTGRADTWTNWSTGTSVFYTWFGQLDAGKGYDYYLGEYNEFRFVSNQYDPGAVRPLGSYDFDVDRLANEFRMHADLRITGDEWYNTTFSNRWVLDGDTQITINAITAGGLGDRKIIFDNVDAANAAPDDVKGGAFFVKASETPYVAGQDPKWAIVRDWGADYTHRGTLVFSNNRAQEGGAVHSLQHFLVEGMTTYQGNLAAKNGGGIFMAGEGIDGYNILRLDANYGDISFTGNYSGVVFEADGQPIAVDANGDRYVDTRTHIGDPLNWLLDIPNPNQGKYLTAPLSTLADPRQNSNAILSTNQTVQNQVLVGSDIHLVKNIDVQVRGDNYIYIDSGITSDKMLGGNSMTVAMENDRFIRFGENSVSYLSHLGTQYGGVDVNSGTMRVDGTAGGQRGEFYANGNGLFNVNENATLAGGGIVGSGGGFVVSGTLSPDSFIYTTPVDLNRNGENPTPDPANRVIGQLDLHGNVTLANATYKIDTDYTNGTFFSANHKSADLLFISQNDGDVVDSTGKLTLDLTGHTVNNDQRTNLNITNLAAGQGVSQFVIAATQNGIFNQDGAAITNANVMDYFVITADDNQPLNGRRGASLLVVDKLYHNTLTQQVDKDKWTDEKDIVLLTSDNASVYLYWNGSAGESAIWHSASTLDNWYLRGGAADMQAMRNTQYTDMTSANRMNFQHGDYVYFDTDPGTGEPWDHVELYLDGGTNGIFVSGMEVLSGSYRFYADDTQTLFGRMADQNGTPFAGVMPTGKLVVSGSGNVQTVVELDVRTDFIRGTDLTGNVKVILGKELSLGEYDNVNNSSAADRSVAYGVVSVLDGVTTIHPEVANNHNHFEVLPNAAINFEFEPTATYFRISDVNTSAQGYNGGAMYLAAGSTFARNNLETRFEFADNTAVQGGAIYADDDLTLQGNMFFSQNRATGQGGAIYMSGNGANHLGTVALSFDTTAGNVVFDGNKMNYYDDGTNPPTYDANSVFLNGYVDMTFVDRSAAGNYVLFNDPIKSGTIGHNSMASGAGFNGTVQFKGDNYLNVAGSPGGVVNLQGGTFRLAGGYDGHETYDAAFNIGGASGAAFTLGSGATLAGQGRYTISSTESNHGFVINGTLAPDSAVFTSSWTGTTLNPVDDKFTIDTTTAEKFGVLGFNGKMTLNNAVYEVDLDANGATDLIRVTEDIVLVGVTTINAEVDDPAASNGQSYMIMFSTGLGTSFLDENGVAAIDALTAQAMVDKYFNLNLDPRQGGTLAILESITGSGTYDQLWINGISNGSCIKIYWTGAMSDDWDANKTMNWITNRNGTDLMFQTGDYVIFDDSLATGVDVTNYDVDVTGGFTVGGMEVVSGAYTFTGNKGKITGADVLNAPGNGTLLVSGGTATIGVETDFVGGTVMTGGRIDIDHAKALGVYNHANFQANDKDGYVDVQGNATIGVLAGAGAAKSTVTNRFNVAPAAPATSATLNFDVAQGETLTIQNVDTTIGATPENGGAIVLGAGGNLTTTGSGTMFLKNNQANNGGGIYATGALTLDGDWQFGEINSTNPLIGPVTIGNTAVNDGGAIYALNDVSMTGTATFIGNTAGRYGGAIRAERDVSMTGTTTFERNEARWDGGALYVTGDVSMSGTTTFESNTAAGNFGGALYVTGDVTMDGTTTFRDNHVTVQDGGAIYSNGRVSIDGTATFEENTANWWGGAICSNGQVSIDGTATFTANEAGVGGAIYTRGTSGVDISGTGSSFTNNKASFGAGGAIYTFNSGVTISGAGTTFEKNTAANSGGAIHANGAVTISGSSLFSPIRFEGNRANTFGGAIFANGAVVIESYTLFNDNHAGDGGGAIYSSTGVATHLIGMTAFTNNTAVSGGGAINTTGDINIGILAGFSENKATGTVVGSGEGGAIKTEGNVSIGAGTTFIDNTAGRFGGAIYMAGGNAPWATKTLTFNTGTVDITFDGNTAGTGVDLKANSVHLNEFVDVIVNGDGNVRFNDPINATAGGNTFTMNGTGTAYFSGDSVLNNVLNAGAAAGEVDINTGTMRLVDGATFDAGDSVFTIARDGATFGTLSGNGTATATRFVVNGALSADSRDDATTPSEIGTLTLDGAATFETATLIVDLAVDGTDFYADLYTVTGELTTSLADRNMVTITDIVSGTFDIVEADNGTLIDKTHFYVDPASIGKRANAEFHVDNTRAGVTVLQLVTDTGPSMNLLWTGYSATDVDGDNIWVTNSSARENWIDKFEAGYERQYFLNGDSVTFTSDSNYVVRQDVLLGGNVKVSGANNAPAMQIYDAGYTFGNVDGEDYTIFGENGADLVIDNAEVTLHVNVDFDRNLSVNTSATGNTSQTLEVTGTATFGNNVTVNDVANVEFADLTVGNMTTKTGNLVVDNTGLADSTLIVDGDLDVAGGIKLENVGTMKFLGDVNASSRLGGSFGSLLVNADNYFTASAGSSKELSVTGSTTTFSNIAIYNVDKVAFQGALTTTGNQTVNVEGDVYLEDVDSATFGILNVAGLTKFTDVGSVTIGDDSTFGNGLEATDSAIVLNGDNTNAVGTTLAGVTNVTLGSDTAFGKADVAVATDAVVKLVSNADRTVINNIANNGDLTINAANGSTFAYNGVMIGGTLTAEAGTLLFGGTLNTTETVTVDKAATLAGSGTLTAANTLVSGTLSSGNVIPGGHDFGSLNLVGDMTLNEAVIDVYLGKDVNDRNVSNTLQVDGKVYFEPDSGLNTVNIASGTVLKDVVGEYTVIATMNGFDGIDKQDVLNRFDDVTLGGQKLGKREYAAIDLKQQNMDLVLTIKGVNNMQLVWSGGTAPNPNDWDLETENWFDPADRNATFDFANGDYVIFNDLATQSEVKIQDDYTVSGMEIDVQNAVYTNNYKFSGGKIIGKKTDNDFSTGSLDILSTVGTVSIYNEMAFEGGTQFIGNGDVEIVLGNKDDAGNNKSLGATGNAREGFVTIVDGKNVTFDTVDGASALLQNRFESNGGSMTFKKAAWSFTNSKEAGLSEIIKSAGDVTINGGATFTNQNGGALDGWAVSMTNGADLTLATSNTANSFVFTGSNRAAVLLSGKNTMTLSGKGNFDFQSGISGTGANDFLMNGTGTVMLYGANTIGTSGKAEINGGTLELNGGASPGVYSLDIGSGTFLLANTANLTAIGDTSIKATGGITLKGIVDVANAAADTDFGTLALNGDTTFENSEYLVYWDENDDSSQILVTGNVVFDGDNILRLDDSNGWHQGTYELIVASGTMSNNPTSWDIHFGGTDLDNDERKDAILKVENSTLLLTTIGDNLGLVWAGEGNRKWDTASSKKNWKDDDGKYRTFMDYDSVLFNGAGPGTVTIVDNVTVADMTVTGGEYIFTGKNISGKANGSTLENVGGNLDISGGRTTFNVAGCFEGDITITGNGTHVALTENGKLQANGVFLLGGGTTLEMTPTTGSIKGSTVTLDGTLVSVLPEFNDPTKDNYIESVIVAGTELNTEKLSGVFDISYGLVEQEAVFTEADKVMNLQYTSLTPTRFAYRHKLSHNEKEVAKNLTGIFGDQNVSGDMKDLRDFMYRLETAEAVGEVIDQMRGSEMYADGLAMALWSPWRKVFNNLDSEYCINGHLLGASQPRLNQRKVWFDGYYRHLEASSDGNARKYTEKRGGMMIGMDSRLSIDTTVGLTFGYGNPRLSHKFGKVEANDYTLALYSRSRVTSNSYMNGFLGFGIQDNEGERYERVLDQKYRSEYDGYSLYVSLEWVRPVKLDHAKLFPLIALDYQRAWNDEFVETGGRFAQRIDKASMESLVARIGINAKVLETSRTSLKTRLQYGYLIGGDAHGDTKASFVSNPAGGTFMNLRGVNVGRNRLNAGVGGEWFAGNRRGLRFFLDYDYDYGDRTDAHTGQIGFDVRW